ncbi:cysteine desulfurase [Candidatus Gottesmanbacteria bacterium]|nr:cysteine desulfurase [Candidatus Gottesmanbacteria bacterium]
MITSGNYYLKSNANIHRGIHALAEKATEQYETARKKVAKFINAKSEKEIIFVRNTTEALNLLAFTLKPEEVTTTIMEHHSNYLPWQRLAEQRKIKFKVLGINKDFELSIKNYELCQDGLLAITHASNVLGIINPIHNSKFIIHNSYVVVDGAQAVSHFKVDVQKLGCDFYAFSGHKMFGPTGIGVLWGKQELLEKMPPFLVGGGMISGDLPEKFEAGTPNIAGAIGLGTAVDYLEAVGFQRIMNYELRIMQKMQTSLEKIPQIKLFCPKKNRVPVFSFSIDGVHAHDAAQFLNDKYNIAVRAGQHCAGPLHQYLDTPATLRASLAFYNTEEEIDIFLEAIKDLIKTFS